VIVSDAYITNWICRHEGLRTTAYLDSGGVRTIGCGHTGSGTGESPITIERAYELAREDVASSEGCINRNVAAPLTQSMFDALVSLAFNMGCTGLMRTGVVDLVNARRYHDAAEKIRSVGLRDRNGTLLRGLVTRRENESAMFLQDGLPSSSAKAPAKTTTTIVRVTPSSSLWLGWTTLAVATVGMAWAITRTVQRKPLLPHTKG
jgi:lysozyme